MINNYYIHKFVGFETTMIAELPALNIERILLNWDCKAASALKPLPSNADCEMKLKSNENGEAVNNNNNLSVKSWDRAF